MNNHHTALHAAEREALEARLGLRIAGRLSETAEELPADLSERLRFAREQALARRKRGPETAAEPVVVGAGSSAALASGMGRRSGSSWWWSLASLLPVALLLAGLFFIERLHEQRQAEDAAEIDSALLADDLPPDAYADPGFAEFLKARQP
ncbi:DUF3619 family protein [Aquabacterium sp. A7-Y]|uniref:DUF3619 family protein n=1 Tax=Aquabacterium sp. A7-Y TaxID=1349605 RepID=UPI00223D51E0|nr:DUF3619 family protein [Aquabacterium sp. A7-Y]MCW7541494.1 DUF3619 family protein [Aquabacterium sp. A7-Y]